MPSDRPESFLAQESSLSLIFASAKELFIDVTADKQTTTSSRLKNNRKICDTIKVRRHLYLKYEFSKSIQLTMFISIYLFLLFV